MNNARKVVPVVLFYMCTSISLVFFNKFVMHNYEFPYPVTVTWFQVVVALACATVCGELGRTATSGFFYAMPPMHLPSVAQAQQIVRLALIFVGMLMFNNFCLNYVEVSFYQVARSLTTVYSVLLSYYVLGQRTSLKACAGLLVLMVGYLLGVKGEVHFSTIGVVFGLLSSLFVALYSIDIKFILRDPSTLIVWPPAGNPLRLPAKDDNRDDWLLMIFTNELCFVLLIPLIFLTGEAGAVLASPMLADPTFWLLNLAAGVMGFLINIATFMQVKATGPVTHNVVATAKAGLQTVLSVLIWHNPISVMNGVGIALTLVGFLLYALIREMENRAAQPSLPVASTPTSKGNNAV